VHSVKVNFDKYGLYDYLPKSQFQEILIGGDKIPVLRNRHIGPIQRNLPWKITFRSVQMEKLEVGLFRNVTNVEDFEASYGLIRMIPEGIFNGENLKYVSLRDNKIRKIASRAFDNMTNLVELNLSRNRLKVIDSEWFYKCHKLATIYFSYNAITQLSLMSFKNLNFKLPWRIYLDYNEISTASEDTFLQSLKDLDNKNYFKNHRGMRLNLKGNKLTCVPKDLSRFLVAKVVTLRKNPLTCECLQRINSWLRDHPNMKVLLDGKPRCKLH
jgi:Leucine-rich repeat (LRR) protein